MKNLALFLTDMKKIIFLVARHNEHLFSIIMLNLLVLQFGRDVVLRPPAPAATATDLWSNYLRMFSHQMKFFHGNKRTQGVYH
jgi:hypothetical protein